MLGPFNLEIRNACISFQDALALNQLIATIKSLISVITDLAESVGVTFVALRILMPSLALIGFDQTLILDSPPPEYDRAKLLEVILVLLFKLKVILRVVFQIA